MSARARWIFLVSAPMLAILLVWSYVGLHGFGTKVPELGSAILSVAIPKTHATNVVTAVNFSFRAIDTLGEEMILFAATTGCTMLLRLQDTEEEGPPEAGARTRRPPHTSDAIRSLGLVLLGPAVAVGFFTVSWSDVTPGGGFQGGAILASALAMVFFASEYQTMLRLRPVKLVELAEATGAFWFVALGALSLLLASSFFQNYLPKGAIGNIISGGLMLPTNVCVLLAVGGGFILIVSEFLEQTLVFRQRT